MSAGTEPGAVRAAHLGAGGAEVGHVDLGGAPLPPLPSLGGAALRNPPQAGAARRWQRARVVAVRRQSASVSTFRLALPVWEAHLPGQHYVVRLEAADGYRAERSYSVASAPEDVGHVELAVERLADGEVSTWLHDHLAVGDAVTVRGPFGGWFVWRGRSPALLVGGGSGVVPLVAMLRHARARREAGRAAAPLAAVVSFRDAARVLFAEEWVQATVALTREGSATGRPAGRLTVDDVAGPLAEMAAASSPHAPLEVFVCGSTPFAAAAEAVLARAGSPASALRVERFGPSAPPA